MLTPPTTPEAIAITKEINGGRGSRFGADRGQSLEPIHTLKKHGRTAKMDERDRSAVGIGREVIALTIKVIAAESSDRPEHDPETDYR